MYNAKTMTAQEKETTLKESIDANLGAVLERAAGGGPAKPAKGGS